MKKTIAATLAIMMLGGLAVSTTTPAAAASYSMHPTMHTTVKVIVKHPKHWRQHLWCKTKWRHHHKVKVCIWVPNHH